MYVITDYFQTFSELAPILYFPIMLIHVCCIAPKETAIKNPLKYELCPSGSLIVLDVLPSLRRRPWLSARFFDRKIKRFPLMFLLGLILQHNKFKPICHIKKDEHDGKEQPGIVINAIRINEVETNCSCPAMWSSGIGQRSLLHFGGSMSLCL